MADPFELFFREYAAAFDAFDAERIAGLFHCPCLMVSADIVVPLTTQHAIVSNMQGLVAYHRQEGYARARVSDVRVSKQAPNLAHVTVRWQVLRADESVLWDWKNDYELVDYGDGWKILVSTTYADAPV
jgi:hypothetical protein